MNWLRYETARSSFGLRRTAVLLGVALSVGLPVGPAHAATGPLDLYVGSEGSDLNNDCQAAARPCRSLQRAVDVAALPEATGRHVRIGIGPGTFVPRDGGVHVIHGTVASLSIVGAGIAGTVLRTPLPDNAEVVALTVAAGFAAPVTVEDLRITGYGFDAPPGSGRSGSYVTGIRAGNAAPLHLDSVRIDRLRGGHGAGAADAPGGDGGSVYGIDRTGGPMELSSVQIVALSGGTGGTGRRMGGAGGSAFGVSTDATLGVVRSSIGGLRGGRGGPGASGGGAYSVVAQAPAPTVAGHVVDSELSGNRGGRGGAGPKVAPGKPGAKGGQGGEAIGLSYVGHLLSIQGSTLSEHRGAPGGRGGPGGVAAGTQRAGPGGHGGGGGGGAGVVAIATGTVAAIGLANSTASNNRAGAGGAGGPGRRAGAGGDAGPLSVGVVSLAAPEVALTTSAVHVTAIGNTAGAGGVSAADDEEGRPTGTAAGLFSNAPIGLAASLFANGESLDCLLSNGAAVLDGGGNVASDSSCFQRGVAGSTVAPGIGGNLAALAQNGGPTRTHALDPNSPAARAVPAVAGLCAGAFAVDQRGEPRPGSGSPHYCAAGAYEPE